MNRKRYSHSPNNHFEIHQINSTGKIRDSPTSSILKTPTPIFVTTRSSSAKTKRLTFANGPVDLQTLKNGTTYESNESFDSGVDAVGEKKLNNGEINFEDSIVEVAVSPVKTMKVSPESWKAFLEYKKYADYSNDTEKTDYTYSRLSKFRHKEIIPGILIRPNLSRISLTSRRSSLSFPSSHSSFNESYHSGSYDFKVFNQSDSAIFNDLKTSDQSNKTGRSKYYLRSSDYDWKEVGEAESDVQNYLNKEYYGHSPSEKIIKSYAYETTKAPESTTHYSNKVRSMDFDDADIDEVDVNPVHSERHYYSPSTSSAGRVLKSQTNPGYLTSFFTTVLLYMTSIGTSTKDAFSKYVLRKQDGWDGSSSNFYDRRNEHFQKSTASDSWMPWGDKRISSTANYYSGGSYYQPRNWYQNLYYYCNNKFNEFTNLISGSTSEYSSYRTQNASGRRRFWWLLIPLLLLAGFWLYKAEQETGFLTNQYEQLDCKTNGFLTSMKESIKPIWRSSYVAYKRGAAAASCYINDSWERLKLPFTHISEWLCSKFSNLSEGSLSFIFAIWNVLWRGLWNFVGLTAETFSSLCMFILDFLTDFLSAVKNLLYYVSSYFIDAVVTLSNGLGWIFGSLASSLRDFWSYLYLIFFSPRNNTEFEYRVPAVEKACVRQKENIELVKSGDVSDCKSITWDLSSIKKKIDDLELEFRREKEARQNQFESLDKQLDNNHKTLQNYQATVNQALHSVKKPPEIQSSSIQYLLDNQADALKQWITQNFLLKSDSGLDENKINLLMAQYSNKTGEELLALKKELKLFVENHKTDLESLRNNFNSLEADNFGSNDVSLAFIKKLISDAIRLYDADKTGRVDYALETAGGQVQSVRCTETYTESPKSYVLLGWAVYTEASSPRDAISPGMAAGQCWAFVGSQGFLVLQLSHTIRVTGFTMEHISKSLVPRGHIESAPKNFSMWGLKNEHDADPYLFGEYMYLDNDETLQYFRVTYPTKEQYNMVELKITSNHGNPNYTCLYRIRVHGEVEPIHL